MFTGIIQGTGTVVHKASVGGGLVLTVEAGFDLTDPEEGESIAVNGACLTARDIKGNRFVADVSPESIARTGLGRLVVGSRVNLERALRLSDRLGGHIVSGHVDCQGVVRERTATGDFTIFTFALESDLTRYIIEKGSITINGISLTVNSCTEALFSVSIIPHTLVVTNLGELQQGDRVNVEVDIIGKYVEKLLTGNRPESNSSISTSFLAEHGFL
ncbi:MAG: riboflavin synthase [Desulfobulbus propionicus]|nr:MAG: riboflavin synthase [Desulfobulbus propionicus]